MTVATLSEVLRPALAGSYAVGGLVVLGWGDAVAFVDAAEAENVPVILQAGPGCRAHTPLPVLGAMFRTLAERARVPVVCHLDHGKTIDECHEALDCGFTSIMFDGSQMPFADNAAQTAKAVVLARRFGASCEGELGHVGYPGDAEGTLTDPKEAKDFIAATGVDALAISAGNVHLQQRPGTTIHRGLIDSIGQAAGIPLVLHGSSGILPAMRRELAQQTAVCKFNVGTELRQAYGTTLRKTLELEPGLFDRIAIEKAIRPHLVSATRKVLRDFKKA